MKQPAMKGLTLAIFTGLTLGAMQAESAALLNPTLVPGENTFQDTNGDWVTRLDNQGNRQRLTPALDGNGDPITNPDGSLDYSQWGGFQVGDAIDAVLTFETINGLSPFNNGLNPTYDLLAYSRLMIGSLTLNDNGTPADSSDDFYDVVYTAANDPDMNTGVLVEVYENDDSDFLNFADGPSDVETFVRSQSLIAEFGLGDTDDFWVGQLPLTIQGLEAVGAGTGTPDTAAGVFGLSVLSNPGLIPIATNGIVSGVFGTTHDIVGNSSAKERSSTFNELYTVETDTQVKFNVEPVPEPGIFMLMGAGLVGLGFARRRANA